MEIGVTSFADLDLSRPPADPGRRLRELVEEIELADAVGLDAFGVGEHHRPDFAVSAPAVALAGAATRTRRIRLASAVTVLSTDDPVRVFEQFATLDQLSDGRAEIIAGRGSFTESYPLFGASLDDYDELFSEKLEPPIVRQQFEAGRTPRGAIFCGDPQQVADKILAQHELFGHTRFLAHMGMGGLEHDKVLRAIELLGTEVAPRVREEVARRREAGTVAAGGRNG